MMDTIDYRQRLCRLVMFLLAAGAITAPTVAIVLYAAAWLCRRTKALRIACSAQLLVLAAALMAHVWFCINLGVLAVLLPFSLADWLTCNSSLLALVPTVAALGLLWCRFGHADQFLLEAEQRRKGKQYRKVDTVPVENRTHEFVAGTTGSGKTTWLLQIVADSIRKGEPLYIVSGKCGTDDDRSLLNVTKRLAAQYDRPLYLVSMSAREATRRPYNPLADMTPTELADALTSMTEYTEPHYKACASTWLKAIAECLRLADIPVTLAAVLDFYSYDDLMALVAKLKADEKLSKMQAKSYTALRDIAEQAALSRARYADLMYGDGASLFGTGTDTDVSAAKARADGAIFFVDLDSFRYTDFTRAVGRLFTADIRHIISTETDMQTPKRVVMDELGAFATDSIMPVFSQARSFAYQITVATQSIADLDEVSPTFAERVLENCSQYAVLQLNSADDAERMSNIIGTYDSVETTRKSAGSGLDESGAGTKKVVRAFKVPPDTIKELPPVHALYYDKKQPERVTMVEIPFITLD